MPGVLGLSADNAKITGVTYQRRRSGPYVLGFTGGRDLATAIRVHINTTPSGGIWSRLPASFGQQAGVHHQHLVRSAIAPPEGFALTVLSQENAGICQGASNVRLFVDGSTK